MSFVEIYRDAGVHLEASGDKWRAPCPFHSEAAPSFFVYPDGSYHCFGCGAHGTVDEFSFENQEYALSKIDIENIVEEDKHHYNIRKSLEKRAQELLNKSDYLTRKRTYAKLDALFLKLNFLNLPECAYPINLYTKAEEMFSKLEKDADV